MFLNQSIVLNTPSESDGAYRVSGWIKCPGDSRVILRFLTGGTPDDKVEGLHWGATGGWYKYLPATGDREFFEVSARFDAEVHGKPEIRIERWFGTGKIELLLQDLGNQPLTLFWGDDESFSTFKNIACGLVERFDLSSGLVAAAAPKNLELIRRLDASSDRTIKTTDLQVDIEKSALDRVQSLYYDALVIDLKSLCTPLIEVDGTYIEVTREARALGAVSPDAIPIEPGTDAYSRVLRNSLVQLLRFVRPKPVFIFDSERLAEFDRSNPTKGTLDSMIEDLELEAMGFLTSLSRTQGDPSGINQEKLRLDEFVRSNPFTFDEHMIRPTPSSHLKILTHPSELSAIEAKYIQGLPTEFSVEIDVLVSSKYKANNLVLTLHLENLDGTPVDENLGKFSIAKSKTPRIGYFKYFPPVQNSETATFKVELPENVLCVGLSVNQVRDQGPVFISRIEIQTDQTIQLQNAEN